MAVATVRSVSLSWRSARGALVTDKSDESGATANEPRWDVKDVAKFLNLSKSWVYQHADKGEIPHRRLGALYRFDPEIIRRYARGEPVVPKVIALKIQR